MERGGRETTIETVREKDRYIQRERVSNSSELYVLYRTGKNAYHAASPTAAIRETVTTLLS